MTHRILDELDRQLSLIRRVADRPGHDRRYRLDTSKLRALGWVPRTDFRTGLAATVKWYVRNEWWWRPIKEGSDRFRSCTDRQ